MPTATTHSNQVSYYYCLGLPTNYLLTRQEITKTIIDLCQIQPVTRRSLKRIFPVCSRSREKPESLSRCAPCETKNRQFNRSLSNYRASAFLGYRKVVTEISNRFQHAWQARFRWIEKRIMMNRVNVFCITHGKVIGELTFSRRRCLIISESYPYILCCCGQRMS
ncbi:hypothetical protein CDAR_46121 [Caerostris darwini]|uniref:Uncharacterized protein n=1 Tax=Caerostris darwini TaxID=1538125 RepID=A0AAV4U177_9ARAC|nr:hypothetical protein CDAR_46121 [Caerostris darwini]